jgi:3,4-dihydroxy 2-butanone 4-phosphate synthase/GTP cyclohydrolase II
LLPKDYETGLPPMLFAPIPEILKDLRRGEMVLLLDDQTAESQGDVVCAAEKVTVKALNFMASHARGLIRLSLPAERCEQLHLEVQSTDLSLPGRKAFTISIDARDLKGSGVSMTDRVKTIRTAVSPDCRPADLVRPGHVLPLRAQMGGVLVRAGKTEGSVDLARLAGLTPAGVFCEALNRDGDPMNYEQLRRFSGKYGLRMCTLADIIEHRLRNEQVIERGEDVELPTWYGDFRLIAFRSMRDPEPHTALCKGGIGDMDESGRVVQRPEPVLVRVQLECLPGCALGSTLCRCGELLRLAQARIQKEGKGAIVLLRGGQEGGPDEVVHPHALGPAASQVLSRPNGARERRDFGLGSQILRSLGLSQLRVLTNSRRKFYGLEGYGLSVVERIPLR